MYNFDPYLVSINKMHKIFLCAVNRKIFYALKDNSGQTYSCPRDKHLSASWAPIGSPHRNLQTITTLSCIEGLEGGPQLGPIMPRDEQQKILIFAVQETGVSRHNAGELRALLKPLNTIMLRCMGVSSTRYTGLL